MRQREYVGFLVVAAILLAAGWFAGSGNAVSAQGAPTTDCHFTLFGDRYMSTRTADRPDVFRLDECTGNTWVLNHGAWQWVPVAEWVPITQDPGVR